MGMNDVPREVVTTPGAALENAPRVLRVDDHPKTGRACRHFLGVADAAAELDVKNARVESARSVRARLARFGGPRSPRGRERSRTDRALAPPHCRERHRVLEGAARRGLREAHAKPPRARGGSKVAAEAAGRVLAGTAEREPGDRDRAPPLRRRHAGPSRVGAPKPRRCWRAGSRSSASAPWPSPMPCASRRSMTKTRRTFRHLVRT